MILEPRPEPSKPAILVTVVQLHSGGLLHITVTLNGGTFSVIVDTGVEVSIILPCVADKAKLPEVDVTSPNLCMVEGAVV